MGYLLWVQVSHVFPSTDIVGFYAISAYIFYYVLIVLECIVTYNKSYYEYWPTPVNTLRQRQNDRYFAEDLIKYIFLNEKIWNLIKIALKFVPKGPNNKIPALVLIMAWCWSGDKRLYEPLMVRSSANICVTWPRWVKGRNAFEVVLQFITVTSNEKQVILDLLWCMGSMKAIVHLTSNESQSISVHLPLNSLRPSDTYMHQ